MGEASQSLTSPDTLSWFCFGLVWVFLAKTPVQSKEMKTFFYIFWLLHLQILMTNLHTWLKMEDKNVKKWPCYSHHSSDFGEGKWLFTWKRLTGNLTLTGVKFLILQYMWTCSVFFISCSVLFPCHQTNRESSACWHVAMSLALLCSACSHIAKLLSSVLLSPFPSWRC